MHWTNRRQKADHDLARSMVKEGSNVCRAICQAGFTPFQLILFQDMFRPENKGRLDYWYGDKNHLVPTPLLTKRRLFLLDTFIEYLAVFGGK